MSVLKLTIDLLQAYLSRTKVPPDDLPSLIRTVHQLVVEISGAGRTEVATKGVTQSVSNTPTPTFPTLQ